MTATFLRDATHAPRPTALLARHPGALIPERLEHALELIWDHLLAQLATPIVTTDTRARRVAEFFGCVRYIRSKRSGGVSLTHLTPLVGQRKFVPAKYRWSLDLPMLPNGGFLEHYLCGWWRVLGDVLRHPDDQDGAEAFLVSVQNELWQSLRRSTYWQRLRYALREAIQPDPQILAWARAGRPRHLNRFVCNLLYNRTTRYQAQYAQVQRDNPRLVWLLTFLLDEGLCGASDQVVAWMKREIELGRVSPAGWRLLANGQEKDFRHVRDWIGPDGEVTGRSLELACWLRCLLALRRTTPMAPAIQRLLLHDAFDTAGRAICFRNVRLPVPVVRILLAEAERRLGAGSLAPFVRNDLVEVMTWLEAGQPVLVKNQLKAGWEHLTRRAAEWKREAEASAALGHLEWVSALGTVRAGEWTITPLTNVWQVRREALRQHHCADRYLEECMAGTVRLFNVTNAVGKPVATIGIERKKDRWTSIGIRASCNRAVTGTLVGLDETVVRRYTDVWRLAQTVSPEPSEILTPTA